MVGNSVVSFAGVPSVFRCVSGAVSAVDVTLHDSTTGDVLARLAAGGGVLYALAFSPSGACLLAAGSEALIHAFHCPAGTKRAVVRGGSLTPVLDLCSPRPVCVSSHTLSRPCTGALVPCLVFRGGGCWFVLPAQAG